MGKSNLKVIHISGSGYVVTQLTDNGEAIRVEPDKPPYSTRQAASRRKLQLETEGLIVILKAQGPGPSYAYIRRVGASMSDPRDERNHMLLSQDQEAAYQSACQSIKAGDIEAAETVLNAHFDWVKVEQ